MLISTSLRDNKTAGSSAMISPALAYVPPALAAADYLRAEQFLPYSTERLVQHTVDAPTWLPSGRVWYRTRTARGLTLVVVDPARGTREVIFTEQQVPLAVREAATKHELPELPMDVCRLSADERSISFQVGTQRWQSDLAGGRCEPLPPCDPNTVASPDGRLEAFLREDNVWVRNVKTGRERQLTTDGLSDFGYATDSSGRRHTNRPCLLWSPDSRRIATFQQDQRGVGDMHLVRTERGHPPLQTWKYPMPGDAVIPTAHRVILDVDTAHVLRLRMTPDFVRSASWFGLAYEKTGALEAQWSADSSHLAFISISREHRHARFRLADGATGVVRDVMEERTATFFETAVSAWHAARADGTPNWRYLSATNELIWYSARDNWNHLYLYDLVSGELKNRVTSGNWNVVALLRVDERARVVYFLAVGREPGRHPYFEHLYRTGLDGAQLALLSPEDATHEVSIAPSAQYFLDSYSRPDEPPVAVLRDCDGNELQTLEIADISRLSAIGWRAPVPITVKARDGQTDLYGLMFKPSHFDESRKYPLVNALYSSPLLGSVIPGAGRCLQWGTFSPTYGLLGDAHSLAELGFIVVMIDGMGTPLRSRLFHETNYANYGDATLPDQVAAMQQLALRHAWIDIERAGVYGHSHGGYAAARAMLTHPQLFKVGVSIAGNHDPMSYQDEYGEKFMGPCERYADGSSSFDPHTNLALAGQLQGSLLLIHGTMDDNVPLYHTLLLVRALIDANRDFDLLMLPNQTHGIEAGQAGRYMIRRVWDYLVRHLLGADPPREYQMRRLARAGAPQSVDR